MLRASAVMLFVNEVGYSVWKRVTSRPQGFHESISTGSNYIKFTVQLVSRGHYVSR